MGAPHFNASGSVFRGHYEAFLPAAYAKCLWKTNPRRIQSRLSIEVTTEDGEEEAATTSIQYRSGGVRIVARGFTYSRPTVTIRPLKPVKSQTFPNDISRKGHAIHLAEFLEPRIRP